MDTEERYTGCLVGGAAGDALGYAVEFERVDSIILTYGSEGITEYELRNGIAEISDDTQMTLFTAEGLLNARSDTMEAYVDSIRQSYKDWYVTQTQAPPEESEGKSLVQLRELYCRRAPGSTCMSAIRSGAEGTIENPLNSSKGCGGIMRVAPVGLFFGLREEHSVEWVDMIAAKAAALTHGHPLGYIAAAGLAHIVCEILRKPETSLEAIVDNMCTVVSGLFNDSRHARALVDLVRQAVALAKSDTPDADAVRQLGEGWVAEETLAMAVFCALRHENNFDLALRASVNHNGDSDSTGAVTGNILGTLLGINQIPQKYKENLELYGVLTGMASALYEVS